MDYQALMEMAVQAGEIMLVSGAEVYRVEDTISRILRQSGLKQVDVFVLVTGIFATVSDPQVPAITMVRRVRNHSTDLNRIYQVNNISRAFCSGKLTVDEAQMALTKLCSPSEYCFWKKCIGYAMVTGFFAVMFSGGILDSLVAALIGVLLALVLGGTSKLHFNDFCQNATGSFVLAMSALFLRYYLFPAMNLDAVIISAIMPMVPGVSFTAAIRDILNGDYSSGVARIAEAVVVALAVAFGVGVAMTLIRILGGRV